MELYIFASATTAILWLILKMKWTIDRFRLVKASTEGWFAPWFKPLSDHIFREYARLFAADAVISTIIAMGCRLLIPGRVGAAVSATIGLAISVGMYLDSKQNGQLESKPGTESAKAPAVST